MGCSVGRHSLGLARRGFKVTGVDRTDDFFITQVLKISAMQMTATPKLTGMLWKKF